MIRKTTLATLVITIMFAVLLPSCGRKGPPRLPGYERPSPPANLVAVRRPGEVALGWQYAGGDEDVLFGIHREPGGEVSVEGNSYVDRQVVDTTSYVYTVRAGEGEPARIEIGPCPEFPVVHGVLARVLADSLTLEWEGSEGVLYNVYQKTGKGKYGKAPVNAAPLSGTFLSIPISTDEAASFRVKAIMQADGQEVYCEGPLSDEAAVLPEHYVPAAPLGVEAVPTGEGVLVFWKESPEHWVRGYEVFRAEGRGEFLKIGQSGTPAFTDASGPPKKAVYYKVRAMGPAVAGSFSAVVNVNPPAR